jgi:superfamily II DNA/RNA helicase
MKFEELGLKPELLKATIALEYVETTEIQEKTIPVILSGKDIVGTSQTGSGKTAAFGLPILNSIVAGKGVQAIILTPTRELCVQVHDTLKMLGKYLPIRYACVYGGVSIGPQIDDLRRADIVVGTPGRTLDHLDRRSLALDKVKYFVLDEADKMLEMGFIDDIMKIIKHTPRTKQSLMFSATMPVQIRRIVDQYFNHPTLITGQKRVDNSLLRQVYYNIEPNQKFSLLVHLIKVQHGVALIFCATRHEVDLVTDNLCRAGVKSVAIHGGLTQGKRLQVVDMIKKEHVKVLVATDVAARGLDIKNITHVFNYDVPRSPDEYIHRIGRTARAGEEGDAITLLTHVDYDKFSKVLSDRSLKVEKAMIPKFENVMFERPRSNFGGGGRGGGFRSSGGGYRPREGSHRDSSSEGSRSEGRNFGSQQRRTNYRR